MKLFSFVLLILVFLDCLLLAKTSRAVSLAELKRRAAQHPASAYAKIYRLMSYQKSAETFIWLAGAFSFTAILVSAVRSGWLLAVALILVSIWLTLNWNVGPKSRVSWAAAGFSAPLLTWLVSFIHPLLSRLPRIWPSQTHTKAYEKEDFLKIIKLQARQPDNRIAENDLKIAFHALSFADKAIGQIMTPLRAIKTVSVTDSIGPHLMDELHSSGFSRFPVVKEHTKSAAPQIIGTLYIQDLIDHPEGGSVRDLMHEGMYFVNESEDLRSALKAFLKAHDHLLVVQNNFNETVGVITLEDMLEQLLGERIHGGLEIDQDSQQKKGVESKPKESKK